jgi:hypothetical protein
MTFNDMPIPAVGCASLVKRQWDLAGASTFEYRWHVVAEMPFDKASFNLSRGRAGREIYDLMYRHLK